MTMTPEPEMSEWVIDPKAWELLIDILASTAKPDPTLLALFARPRRIDNTLMLTTAERDMIVENLNVYDDADLLVAIAEATVYDHEAEADEPDGDA